MLIGLTGGIGSGKTSVAAFFKKIGIAIIYTDEISRELVKINSPYLLKIKKHFGESILQADGTLNRAKLRNIIFNDISQKEWLESLLHPGIRIEIKKQAKAATSPYSIVEIPLLMEAGFKTDVDRILVVDTTEALQKKRASTRDRLSKADIDKILHAQLDRETRLKYANDIIDNTGTLEELEKSVMDLHQQYLKLSTLNNH
ncbi:MAG: hypothetical protein JWM09_1466 [Francisellaceae bacterium]|nr:hypothetical protein [Francisellaceae bacterium]